MRALQSDTYVLILPSNTTYRALEDYKNVLRDIKDERCLQSCYHRQLHRYNNSRHFSITNTTTSSQVAEKTKPGISVLGKLRKRTGYSLSLCKKALTECNQDIEKAKIWLDVSILDKVKFKEARRFYV